MFDFDAKIGDAIEQAKVKHKRVSEQLQIHPFIFEKFGKQECKRWSISPDSVMQLGFQVRLQLERSITFVLLTTKVFDLDCVPSNV